MPIESDPSSPARNADPHGIGYGLGGGLHLGNPNEPTDPAWGEVIGGIWDRITRPIPG